MNYYLSYSGSPGSVSATLSVNGLVIETTSGLKNEKAARKWAKDWAQAHKRNNTVESARNHSVYTTISGNESFSL